MYKYMNKLRQPLLAFLPLNCNHGFIPEYIVQSHFVLILNTLFSTPNYSIVGNSSILKMLDRCCPQNTWFFNFCGELSFSVLYPGTILPQKFTVIEYFCE